MPAGATPTATSFSSWVAARWIWPSAVLPARYTHGRFATVAVNEFVFKQPVRVGDI